MVYLINAVKTDLYKLGYTDTDIESRIKALQTGCPYKLELIHSVNGSLYDEKKLHKLWNHVRENGEWFQFKTEFVLNKVCSDMDLINKETEGDIILIEWKQHLLDTLSGEDKSFRSERGISNLLELAILNIKLEHYDESIRNIVEYLAHLNGRYDNNDYVKNTYIPSKTKANKSSDDLFIYENEMIYKTKIGRKENEQ